MHPDWKPGRVMQLGAFALLLCLGIAPMHAQDAAQQTPAPHPIFLPPPPDDTPPTKPAAKPAPKAALHSKPIAKAKLATAKQPPAKATAAATPTKPADSAKSIAPTIAPAKPATAAKTSAPAMPPAALGAKTVVVPTPVSPQQPAVVAAPKAEPTPEEVPVVSAGPPPDPSVTFGFYSGETRSQVISAVGKDNILKQSGDILEVAAAPKPDPSFETFLLILSPKQGLVKLIATGKDIDGDSAGRLMKTQFATMKTDLSKGYGDPSDNFDFLDVKATHRGANQFMLSLTNNERSLATYWTKKDFGNQITSVSLEGNGLGNEKGYLSLEYEFAGYHSYLLAKK